MLTSEISLGLLNHLCLTEKLTDPNEMHANMYVFATFSGTRVFETFQKRNPQIKFHGKQLNRKTDICYAP